MAERNEMMQQNQKQNIEQKYYYTVMEEQEGMRLDQFLAGELKEHSRSYIQKLIKEGRVTVGDKKEKPGCRLKVEDSVVICVPPLKELEVLPEKMDLDIIYEDEDVILINKPKDMVVHPCPGRYTGTLVNGLLYHRMSVGNGKNTSNPRAYGKYKASSFGGYNLWAEECDGAYRTVPSRQSTWLYSSKNR